MTDKKTPPPGKVEASQFAVDAAWVGWQTVFYPRLIQMSTAPIGAEMYQKFSLQAVRALPQSTGHCLRVVQYYLPSDVLPNRLPRPVRIVGEAAVRVGTDFHLLARVVQEEGGTRALELETCAWDMATDRLTPLTPGGGLVRAIYSEMCRAHLAAQARRHGRGEGRN